MLIYVYFSAQKKREKEKKDSHLPLVLLVHLVLPDGTEDLLSVCRHANVKCVRCHSPCVLWHQRLLCLLWSPATERAALFLIVSGRTSPVLDSPSHQPDLAPRWRLAGWPQGDPATFTEGDWIKGHRVDTRGIEVPGWQNWDQHHCWTKQTTAVVQVLAVVTTGHQEVADVFNLSSNYIETLEDEWIHFHKGKKKSVAPSLRTGRLLAVQIVVTRWLRRMGGGGGGMMD